MYISHSLILIPTTIRMVCDCEGMSSKSILLFPLGTATALLSLLLLSHPHFPTTTLFFPLPDGVVGPECFAFSEHAAGPFTGVSDGRILRWLPNETRWADFAVTSANREGCEGRHDHSKTEHKCGRPLGLKLNENSGDLYIADAYMGLLVVGPNGGLAHNLAQQPDGPGPGPSLPFGFTNSLDIHHITGDVYFTDSSTRFSRRNHVSIIISGDDTGRLLKFEPKTQKTTILLNGLRFPNGIALSSDGEFLLFVETTTCKLYKLWLTKAKAGKIEVMAQLQGFPDNIQRNKNGEFWIGINSGRGRMLEWLISNPWIGNALIKALPMDITKLSLLLDPLIGSLGMGIKLDRYGNVIEVLDSSKGKRWKSVSEVAEWNGILWIGSVTRSYIIKENI